MYFKFFFLVFLIVWKAERERENFYSICRFTLSNACNIQAEPGWAWSLEFHLDLPRGCWSSWAILHCLLGYALAGSWVRSRVVTLPMPLSCFLHCGTVLIHSFCLFILEMQIYRERGSSPSCFSRHVSRKLDQKWDSQDSNWYPNGMLALHLEA